MEFQYEGQKYKVGLHGFLFRHNGREFVKSSRLDEVNGKKVDNAFSIHVSKVKQINRNRYGVNLLREIT